MESPSTNTLHQTYDVFLRAQPAMPIHTSAKRVYIGCIFPKGNANSHSQYFPKQQEQIPKMFALVKDIKQIKKRTSEDINTYGNVTKKRLN